MKLSKKEYKKLVQRESPNSPLWKDMLNAFWTGGMICTIGQLILNGFSAAGLDKTNAGTATSITMVFLGALFTGLGLYCRFAKLAGAGTLVPITGFANSVVAPSLEFKTESLILGTSAKMFTIAGPVIVYGVGASVIYGLIYWLYITFF